jgi:hypothetical protein
MGTPRAEVPTNVTDQAVEVVEDGIPLRTVAARHATLSYVMFMSEHRRRTTMAVLHF